MREVWACCLPAKGCSNFNPKGRAYDGWIAFGFMYESEAVGFVERCQRIDKMVLKIANKNEWFEFSFYGPNHQSQAKGEL